MVHNHEKYMSELDQMGYKSSYALLDARDFGLPQARKRVFTVSILGGKEFDFTHLKRKPMANIRGFLESGPVDDYYRVKAPSMLRAIGKTGTVRRLPIIQDYCWTITERPDRAPGCGCLPIGNGHYRYLTERECWRFKVTAISTLMRPLRLTAGEPFTVKQATVSPYRFLKAFSRKCYRED